MFRFAQHDIVTFICPVRGSGRIQKALRAKFEQAWSLS